MAKRTISEKEKQMREELSKLVGKYNNTPSSHKKKKSEIYKKIAELDWAINEEIRK